MKFNFWFPALVLLTIPYRLQADSLTVQFNVGIVFTGIDPAHPYTTFPISSAGSLTLDLVSNGEIFATLVSTRGSILGFGYEAAAPFLNHDFSPISPDSPTASAASAFGDFSSGFACPTVSCGTNESFLIGAPGQFSSVYDIVGRIGGGRNPSNPLLANFYFVASPGSITNQFGAVVTPEPAPGKLIPFVGLVVWATLAKVRGRFSRATAS